MPDCIWNRPVPCRAVIVMQHSLLLYIFILCHPHESFVSSPSISPISECTINTEHIWRMRCETMPHTRILNTLFICRSFSLSFFILSFISGGRHNRQAIALHKMNKCAFETDLFTQNILGFFFFSVLLSSCVYAAQSIWRHANKQCKPAISVTMCARLFICFSFSFLFVVHFFTYR